MNKKNIAEIKKALKHEGCVISKVRLCYVDGDKQVVAKINTSYWKIDEEEQFKYCDIWKKALSGKIDKTLLELDFTDEAKKSDGMQMRLYNMMKDQIADDKAADEFFEEIINNYAHTGNYVIVMAYGDYDVPNKAKDGAELEDSDTVYSFILTSICSVELSKPGLFYSDPDKNFVDATRSWMVQPPQTAFLFPAFTDRQSNIHSIMYYSKKSAEPHEELAEDVLGCVLPMKAEEQKDIFTEVLESALEEEATVENIVNLNRELIDYTARMEEEDEKPVVSGSDINRMLGLNGVQKSIEDSDFQVMADNISEEKYVFEQEGIKLSVSKDFIDLISQQEVDGRQVITIPISGTTLNGVKLRSK